ncbi:MAG TPA: hypothetical protein VME01_08040, partial [Solirubrobacteraceae bacterium]|nr:hypothetical protein [Solirubrobacteraceae bacterium]
GFLALRLVSLTSSLVAMAMLARLVIAQTRDRSAGAVAAGLFAATYGLSGYWFDVGRLDSLFLALTLAALAYGASARGVRGGALLGLLAFLAFFTKQTALIALVPALGWLALRRRPVGLTALLVLGALVLASTLLLDALSGGWYRYYVVSELAGQPWVQAEWLGFWRHDLFSHLWPLCILVLAAGATYRGRMASLGYPLAGAGGLLIGAWFSRLHTGGYLNVLMPAYAACALLAGLAYAQLRRRGPVAALVAAAAVVAQLLMLAYPIGAQIPSHADRVAGAELLARLRKLPGPVLVLRHPWYGTLAGKGSFAQADGIDEVLRSQAPRGLRVLRASLPHALDQDHIQAVVLDTAPPWWLAPQLRREFRLLPGTATRTPLEPLTDLRSSPTRVYVRRSGA